MCAHVDLHAVQTYTLAGLACAKAKGTHLQFRLGHIENTYQLKWRNIFFSISIERKIFLSISIDRISEGQDADLCLSQDVGRWVFDRIRQMFTLLHFRQEQNIFIFVSPFQLIGMFTMVLSTHSRLIKAVSRAETPHEKKIKVSPSNVRSTVNTPIN